MFSVEEEWLSYHIMRLHDFVSKPLSNKFHWQEAFAILEKLVLSHFNAIGIMTVY